MSQYTMTIKVEDLNSKTAAEDALERATGTSISLNDDNEDTKKVKSKSDSNVAGTVLAIDALKTVGVTALNTAIAYVGIVSDDQALQNEITNVTTTVSSTISTGMGIAGAFAASQALGWVTLVLTALSELSNIYVNNVAYSKKMLEYSLENEKKSERLGLLASDKNRR